MISGVPILKHFRVFTDKWSCLDISLAESRSYISELQIRGVLRLNRRYFSYSCDPSLEPCRRDGSNGGSQDVFL